MIATNFRGILDPDPSVQIKFKSGSDPPEKPQQSFFKHQYPDQGRTVIKYYFGEVISINRNNTVN